MGALNEYTTSTAAMSSTDRRAAARTAAVAVAVEVAAEQSRSVAEASRAELEEV